MKSAFWPTITISPSYISLCKLDDARKRDEERWETHVGEGEHVQGKLEERACTCPASPARATHPIVNRAYGLRLSSFTTTQENWEHCWEASNGAIELPWPCIYILQVLKRERGGERGKERERVKEIESSSGQSLKSTLPHMRKLSKQFKFWCVEKTMPFLMQTSSEKKRENKLSNSFKAKSMWFVFAHHHSLFTGVKNTPQSSLDYIVGPITSPQHK